MADEHMCWERTSCGRHPRKSERQGEAREDFRAEGMAFCRLMLSPMPHAKVRGIDAKEALAMPGVLGILTADDVATQPPPSEPILTNEPMYVGAADPRGRGRRASRPRKTRSTRSSSISRSCRSRSTRCEPVPGRPRRAARRQRDRQPFDRPAAAQEGEVERDRVRERARGSAADRRARRRVVVRRRRRGASRKRRSCSTRRS